MRTRMMTIIIPGRTRRRGGETKGISEAAGRGGGGGAGAGDGLVAGLSSIDSPTDQRPVLEIVLRSHGQHDAKPRLAAHHPFVSFGDALERIGFVHGSHAG